MDPRGGMSARRFGGSRGGRIPVAPGSGGMASPPPMPAPVTQVRLAQDTCAEGRGSTWTPTATASIVRAKAGCHCHTETCDQYELMAAIDVSVGLGKDRLLDAICDCAWRIRTRAAPNGRAPPLLCAPAELLHACHTRSIQSQCFGPTDHMR